MGETLYWKMMYNQNTADCFRVIYHIPSFLESRPLSIPMKVMPDTTAEESWTTSEERMKELIGHAWDAVKRLTLQVPNYTLYHYCCTCIQDPLHKILISSTGLIFGW